MLKKIVILAVCFTLVFPINVLFAAPSGGQVVQGQADINQSGAKTTINQSSNRAIVNWQNFDIAKNESVLHNMPSASSAALHRVIGGGGASQLAGELKSNGNIFLVNPAGVVIHKGARIDTGGFMATTHDIANEDFMQGNYLFNKPGHPGASIINQGNITVRDQGFAALVAPTVRNEGVIAARLGKVALASGDAFKLDFYGDDLINFTVPESTVDGLHTTDGTPLGVENTGSIKAEGGVVLLSATQLDGVVASVVNNGGTVSAASAELKGGRIVFSGAGENVDVVNTGTVTASSDKGDGGTVRMVADAKVKVFGTVEAKGAKKGGQVDASGKKETLIAGATISTEGESLGLIRLGGEFQGGKTDADFAKLDNFVTRFGNIQPLASSDQLSVDFASAVDAGQDGTLIAWSNGHSDLQGTFAARFLETSGKAIALPSSPRLYTGGGWLIDPTDITIGKFDSTGITQDNFRGLTQIDATWLSNLMANPEFLDSWVDLEASNNIYVSSSLNGAGKSFELRAGNLITVTANLTNFQQINLFAPNVTVQSATLSATSDIVLGKEREDLGKINIESSTITSSTGSITFHCEDIMLTTSHISALNKYVELWGQITDGNTSLAPADSVFMTQTTIAAKAIDVDAAYVTLSDGGSSLKADHISIYGGRTYNPDHEPDDDEYVRAPANLIQIISGSPGEPAGSIVATGDVWLYTKKFNLESGNNVLIQGTSVILHGNGLDTVITIPVGTQNAPVIRASGSADNTEEHATGIHFLNGTFELNAYSIEADNISWASANNGRFGQAVLTGAQGDAPHIFGVTALYEDGVLATELPFPTLRVHDPDGKVFTPTDPKDPVDPEAPGEAALREMETFWYMRVYLHACNITVPDTVTTYAGIFSYYEQLISQYVQADRASLREFNFDILRNFDYEHYAAVVLAAMQQKQGAGYTSLLILPETFKKTAEIIYMSLYIRATGLELPDDVSNYSAVFKQYIIAKDTTEKAHGVMTYRERLNILLGSPYTGSDDSVERTYREIATSLRGVVREFSGNSSWYESSDMQLREEYLWAQQEMLALIRVAPQCNAPSTSSSQTLLYNQELIKEYGKAISSLTAMRDQLKILGETHTGPLSGVPAAYAKRRNSMISLIHEYGAINQSGDATYTPRNDNALRSKYDTVIADMHKVITAKFGSVRSSNLADLLSEYRLALGKGKQEIDDSDGKTPVDKDKNPVVNPALPSDDDGIAVPGEPEESAPDGGGGDVTGGITDILQDRARVFSERVFGESGLRISDAEIFDFLTTLDMETLNSPSLFNVVLVYAIQQQSTRYSKIEKNEQSRKALQNSPVLLNTGVLLMVSPEITPSYAADVMVYSMYADLAYDTNNTSAYPDNTYIFHDLHSYEVAGKTELGFEAHCFYNAELNQIVITYTGTQFKTDFMDILQDITLQTNTAQFNAALDYYNAVLANPRVAKLMAEKGAEVVLTGHSLGGGLAQYVGARKGVETYAFNPAPVPNNYGSSFPANHENVHIVRTSGDLLTNLTPALLNSVRHETNDFVTIPGGAGHGITNLTKELERISGTSIHTADTIRLYGEHYFF
ncbi:filamentous hemagglutinin N-terminal domain-containing protein [Desulfovibrio sp. OttesenSCG-928-M14]|nr:filamentous hemagglutinin N-terminal domain-containing protein [Desulfovibrio sp. OttesenSCG-928-M14]